MFISLLSPIIQHANAAVHGCSLIPEYRGKTMATTVVACPIRHDQAVVSRVGDSRCYLVSHSDRGASIRLPVNFFKNGYKGYLEDRRPNSEADPYQIVSRIFTTIDRVPKP